MTAEQIVNAYMDGYNSKLLAANVTQELQEEVFQELANRLLASVGKTEEEMKMATFHVLKAFMVIADGREDYERMIPALRSLCREDETKHMLLNSELFSVIAGKSMKFGTLENL